MQPTTARSSTSAGKATVVASGSRIQGEILGDTDVIIEGTVKGKVCPDRNVTVAEGGVVEGDVTARTVRIAGKIVGTVHGKETVEILASGRLEGDVKTAGIVIADGAFFKGQVEMTRGDSAEKQRPSRPEATRTEASGGASS